MKAAIFAGPEKIELVERPEPSPEEKEVKIKVEAAAICGSDLHAYRSGPDEERDSPPGHEITGTVSEVGSQVNDFSKGDRVAVEPLLGCGKCRFCQINQYHLCSDLQHIGGQKPGGFEEYLTVPEGIVYTLADNLSFEEGTLLDPYAVGLHAIKRVQPSLPDTVVIIGDGMIGLSTLQMALLQSPQVILIGINDELLNVASKLGADHVINSSKHDPKEALQDILGERNVDIVYETVGGTSQTISTATEVIGRGGTIGVIGMFQEPLNLDPYGAMKKEINFKFIWSYSYWGRFPEFEITHDLLARGKLPTDELITHRISLDEIGKGFELMINKEKSNAIRVIVTP